MQLLERLAAVAEFEREPVEQFGMGGQRAHAAEIIRRFHQAAAEVILPDAIHDAAPGERIVGVREPLSERDAARALGVLGGEREARGQGRERGERAGGDDFLRLFHVAAMEELDDARFAAVGSGAAERAAAKMHGAGENRFRRGKFRERGGALVERGRVGGERGAQLGFCGAGDEFGALLFEVGELGRGLAFFRAVEISVGEIFPAPARRGFDGIG